MAKEVVSHIDVGDLLRRDWDPNHAVLSVYLNVDQSWERNLNEGYHVVLRNLLRDAESNLPEHIEPVWFEHAAKAITACVEREAPGGQMLVAFADPTRSFEWMGALAVPHDDAVYVGPRPMISPLVFAQDEYEPCLAVLTDRARTRLCVVELGLAQVAMETVAELDVDRPSAAGSDHRLSQSRFQSRAEEHAREHFRNVVDQIRDLAKSRNCRKIVVAGPSEAVTELIALLPEPLRAMLVCTVSLAVDSAEKDIVERVRSAVSEKERENESSLVEDLINQAAQDGRAVLGVCETASATRQGRVQKLVISEDDVPLSEKTLNDIRRAFPNDFQRWVRAETDVRELLVEETLLTGGEVEAIRGKPAKRLNERGQGVGAFLRY